MRTPIVAGNWKMHKTLSEAVELTEELARRINIARLGDLEIVLAPPFPHLYRMNEILANKPRIHLAGQNCHQESEGAYTGEVSATMLRSLGVGWVIVGHSERRRDFGEDDALVAAKTRAALDAGLRPIVCLGESLPDREAGKHFEVVAEQLSQALLDLDEATFRHVVLAYEPVWAIGTGKTASPAQAEEVHRFLRKLVEDKYGAGVAGDLTILYGGSCKPSNAEELFAQPDIDGGLIGGASLKAEDFLGIASAWPGASAFV